MLQELEEWKRQQLMVESSWDVQAVGKLMPHLTIGSRIHENIQPYIEKLQADAALLHHALSVSRLVLDYLVPDHEELAELVCRAARILSSSPPPRSDTSPTGTPTCTARPAGDPGKPGRSERD
ncbi:MAG: hypothetical protein ABI162_07125 [Luteolibacter sp.]